MAFIFMYIPFCFFKAFTSFQHGMMYTYTKTSVVPIYFWKWLKQETRQDSLHYDVKFSEKSKGFFAEVCQKQHWIYDTYK